MTNMNITKDEIEAVKRAAHDNAEGWVEAFGRPYDDPDDTAERIANGEAVDSIHEDTIARALGYQETSELSDEQLLRVWPVYRAALVLRVHELLAERSATAANDGDDREDFSVRFSVGGGAALTLAEAARICREQGVTAEALFFETEDRLFATIDANGNITRV